jgi:hypothetical protein
MIIPAPDEALTAITVIFHKPVENWTADDRTQILRRLREFMRDPAAFKQCERKRRRRKVTK